ncbi:MAG: DUF493 domain-containing protein [Candidatus Thioglobus sp.]|nr:DUF493 domain-containing protein [Candidatus Thioglobus sp.]
MNIINGGGEEIFDFPCDYSIKVFGKTNGDLERQVCQIISGHCGKLSSEQIATKLSSKGTYTAITIKIIAENRSQLEALNSDLQNCKLVAYVL